MMRRPCVLAALLVAGFVGITQAQTTWYVDDDAPNDPGPGDPDCSDPNENGTSDHPFDAIQEALFLCHHGDTVLVRDGTYTGLFNKDIDFGGLAITVRSENGPEYCTIDCEGDGRGFVFRFGEGPDSVVQGFTVINGSASQGGAIKCENSSPTITACSIANNVASTAGGVYCDDSNSTISHCIIRGNIAHNGGGGLVSTGNSRVTIFDCLVSENVAEGTSSGGGITSTSWSIVITNCTIARNTADHGGGISIPASNASAVVSNCQITENSAIHGGGLDCFGADLLVADCTFSKNVAAAYGGALNCLDSNSWTMLCDCILWNDSAPNGPEIALNNAGLTARYSDIEGGWVWVYLAGAATLDWEEGNFVADPLFVDPNEGDFYLSADSPCIDAGCNWVVPADMVDLDDDGDTEEYTPLDLDGEGRFFDDPNSLDTGCGFPPIVDMGAYEFGGTGPQPCFGDFNGDRVIDLADLATLLAHYGETEACEGDLNCDGDVDLEDLAALLAVYRTACD